jgi:hypothetical protein
MTDKFREQPKPANVQSSAEADGGGRPPMSVAGSPEPRSGDPPMETAEATHPFGERSVTTKKRGNPGRRAMTISVVPVPTDRYPAFRRDRDHPLASLDPAARLEEIDEFCGRLRAASLRKAVALHSSPPRAAAA